LEHIIHSDATFYQHGTGLSNWQLDTRFKLTLYRQGLTTAYPIGCRMGFRQRAKTSLPQEKSKAGGVTGIGLPFLLTSMRQLAIHRENFRIASFPFFENSEPGCRQWQPCHNILIPRVFKSGDKWQITKGCE